MGCSLEARLFEIKQIQINQIKSNSACTNTNFKLSKPD